MGRRSNYTAKQKAEVILSVLSKQTTIAEACLIGLAIWAAPVIDPAGRWADDLGGLAAKAGTGFLFVLLLVGPVAICIARVSLLNALVS